MNRKARKEQERLRRINGYPRRRKQYGNWPEIIGGFIGVLLALVINFGLLALSVFIVVKILQWTGVIG